MSNDDQSQSDRAAEPVQPVTPSDAADAAAESSGAAGGHLGTPQAKGGALNADSRSSQTVSAQSLPPLVADPTAPERVAAPERLNAAPETPQDSPTEPPKDRQPRWQSGPPRPSHPQPLRAPAAPQSAPGPTIEFGRPQGIAGSFVQRPPQRPRGYRQAPPPPAVAQAFGRPASAAGSFAPGSGPPQRPPAPAMPVPPAYRSAFGRPQDGADLQRPPGEKPYALQIRESPWWKPDAPRDPWRDPQSAASLSAPTTDSAEPVDEGIVETDKKRRRRIRVRDLPIRLGVVLGICALILGLAGGATGFFLAKTASESPLTKAEPQYQKAADAPAPSDIAGVADKVQPSVVSIDVIAGSTGATGSGVVIEADGYILTNNHVVSMAATSDQAKISVHFVDGSISPGKIVGRDQKSDLAVIKVDKPGLVPVEIGKSSKLHVGDEVVAFGSPLGLAGTVTSGIVSALNRPMHLSGEGSDSDAYILAVQTDAAINHGNSGGALVDANGALIGINSAIASSDAQGGSIGLGFAIPVDYAIQVADSIIKTGKVEHGNLQLSAQSVTDGSQDGALIVRVDAGGAADKAGLKAKDVIVQAGDTKVTAVADLMAVAYLHKPGDKLALKVISGGAAKDVEVTLG